MKFERVYHPFYAWEETAHNMWGEIDDKRAWVEKAIGFMADHKLYGCHMRSVVREWPNSCENALTDNALSKKSWIGQAACAHALGCPEDVVREAWGRLTYEQQFLANKEAERAIQEWAVSYAKGRGVHRDMGTALLF